MGDRNQGRKPLPPDEQTKPRSIRLTDAEYEKLIALGGAAWVRDKIKRAPSPFTKEPT
jgi:hypothetical protein